MERIEEILFYEKTAASLEFFDLRSIRKEVSQIYDGLGDFYALKSLHDNLPGDLERCKFYLERATLADPENFGAWNDRAWVALVLDQPSHYALARQYSEVSLKINGHQQRALYNLSVSEHHDGKFAAAEDLLTRAVREEKWQEKKYVGRLHNLYYNRACARCRLAQNPAGDPERRDADQLLAEAMEDFKEALGIERLGFWDLDDWKSLVEDCYPAGDLGLLTKRHPEAVFRLLGKNFPLVSTPKRDEAIRVLRAKS